MRFNCVCGHGSLVKTAGSFLGKTGRHDVYICEECKRLYVRRFNHLAGIEVSDFTGEYVQNNTFIKNVWND